MGKVKKWLKLHCPDIYILNVIMKKEKLRELRQCFLSEKDVESGEASSENKKKIVARCEKKWKKEVQKVDKLLDNYLVQSKTELADFQETRMDVLFHYFAYGFTPDEYFFYLLKNKSQKEKQEYISDRERFIFTYVLDDIKTLEVFYNKFKTYEKLKKYYKREAIYLENKSDFNKFEEYANRHKVFVRKSVFMGRGKGVELIELEKRNESLKELFDYFLSMGPQILEERIIQSPLMAQVNYSSINTIRCPTLRTSRGIELAPCRFRTGRHGSFVDNAGSGGILAAIDPLTGKVISDGYDEYCNKYEKHPDSGIVFKEFSIPQWEDLRKVVTEMAEQFPNMGYISWDMALTDQGWVIVEGNGSGQFIGAQITAQRGLKKEISMQMANTDFAFR